MILKKAQVDPYQQETEWSCSAACLKAALQHLGYDLPEEDLIDLIGAKENRGAETTDICDAAKRIGFDSWEQGFDSLEDAIEVLKEGTPIIADVQSFNYPGKGHYVVIAGHHPGKGFLLMDPNTKGKTPVDNWRIVSDEEMENIWWDRWMAPPHDLMIKWGVMVKEPEESSGESIEEKLANIQQSAFFDEMSKLADPKKRVLKFIIPGSVLGGAAGLVGSGFPSKEEQKQLKTLATNKWVAPVLNTASGSLAGTAAGAVFGGTDLIGKGLGINRAKLMAAPLIGAGLGALAGKKVFGNLAERGASVHRNKGKDYNKKEYQKAKKDWGRRGGNMGALAGAMLGTLAGAHTSGRLFRKEIQEAAERIFGGGGYAGYQARQQAWGSSAPMPSWLKNVKTKSEAKKIFREKARQNHPDLAKNTTDRIRREEAMKNLNDIWEQAKNHPDFPKHAANSNLNEFLVELDKTASTEVRNAAVMAAKILGGAGAIHGAATADKDESVLGSAVSGGVKGALIGALIGAGLARNATGQTTIPRP